jgi:WD40 repeat protein
MIVSAKKKTVFSGHKGPVYTITNGVGDGEILSGSSDQRLGSWNLETGETADFSAHMPTHIIALASIPDSKIIVAGTSGGTVHFLDPANKKEVKAEKYFDSQVFDIAICEKHHLLFVSSGDGRIVVTDLISFEKLKTLQLSNEKVRNIAIHPNGDSAAVATSNGNLHIFSLPLMQETNNWHAHDLAANCVSWEPGGKYLLSGGRDAHLKVWNAERNFELIQDIPAHNYAIYSITFSPDGQYFATASRDKTVKVWNAENQQLLLRINKEKQDGHVNSVNKVIWTKEGLVSTGDDRAIILWEILIS